MPWDWLHRDWLGHALADLYWLFEGSRPPVPRVIAPRWTTAPRGKTLALPLPRSWLGVGAPTPHTPHSLTEGHPMTKHPLLPLLLPPALAVATIAAGLAFGVGVPTPSPTPAAAVPDAVDAWKTWDLAGGASQLKVDCAGAFRVDFTGASPAYPAGLDRHDLALPGTTGKWYTFRASCS